MSAWDSEGKSIGEEESRRARYDTCRPVVVLLWGYEGQLIECTA